MPAGMQVFNSVGTLVADMTSPTLAFKAKQTVTVPAGSGRIRFVDVVFNNCDIPIFAFKANGASRNFFSDVTPVVGQPTQRSVRCYTVSEVLVDDGGGGGVSYKPNNTTSFTVDIYHFDRPIPPGGAGYGMQLFDELGHCTFDARLKAARVLRVVNGYDTFTFPTSVAPAVIPSHNWLFEVREVPAVGSVELWHRENFKFSGNTVESIPLMPHNYTILSPTAAVEKPNGIFSGIFVNVLGL